MNVVCSDTRFHDRPAHFEKKLCRQKKGPPTYYLLLTTLLQLVPSMERGGIIKIFGAEKEARMAFCLV